MIKKFIPLMVLLFVFAGCDKETTKKSSDNGPQPGKVSMSSVKTIAVSDTDSAGNPVKQGEELAVLETTKGKIIFRFFKDDAPGHVDNFIKLTEKGFYNGLIFHRVLPGFMAQGGCPQGNGMGGPGYTIKAEFNSRKHVEGTVAMARSNAPDSAGSQFYICFKPTPFLDGKYTVFGQIVEGLEVLHKLQLINPQRPDAGVKPDKMKKVYIVKKK